MSEHPPVQDDITIVLQARKVIVHETVRVSVAISAQVDPTQSESSFRNEIHSTLRKFIDADWKIQGIQRSKGSKYENVYVTATARVEEKENHQLVERTNALTRIGFELLNPTVDYSLTFDEIQKVNADLRVALLKQALAETTQINTAFKEAKHGNPGYRISSTRFDSGSNQRVTGTPIHAMMASSSNVTGTATYNIGAAPLLGGGGYQDEADSAGFEEPRDMNVSTQFNMNGTFTLRSMLHV